MWINKDSRPKGSKYSMKIFSHADWGQDFNNKNEVPENK